MKKRNAFSLIQRSSASIFALLSILCAPGCSSLHKSKMTSFEPYTEGGVQMFRFKSEKNEVVYPDNDYGEAVRMQWLSEYIADNKYCAKGYKITSRKAVLGGDIYGLRESYFYIGACFE